MRILGTRGFDKNRRSDFWTAQPARRAPGMDAKGAYPSRRDAHTDLPLSFPDTPRREPERTVIEPTTAAPVQRLYTAGPATPHCLS